MRLPAPPVASDMTLPAEGEGGAWERAAFDPGEVGPSDGGTSSATGSLDDDATGEATGAYLGQAKDDMGKRRA